MSTTTTPLVSFSIARTSKTWPDLRRADHLGITVLARQTVTVTFRPHVTPRKCHAGPNCHIDSLALHAVEHSAGQPLVFHRSGFGRLAV